MKTANGFTAVELLVTMIIGTLSIIAAYQLYSFVLTDSAETRNLAAASNLAYRFLREGSSAVQTPCVGSSTSYTSSIPSNAQLPAGATANVVITCVGSGGTTVSYVTSTINYGSNPTRTVAHATYIYSN